MTSLYVASQGGHDEVVKILVRAKADFNLQSNVSNQTVASTYIQPEWDAEETICSPPIPVWIYSTYAVFL